MRAGDHLRVDFGGEVDHGIDVGDRTVIRWRAGAGVERVERARFAPDGATVEVVVHRERVYRAPQVVARAFSRFSESAYRAMFRSAEQFAVWCKSAQLPAATEALAAPVRKARAAPASTRAAKAKAAPAKKAARGKEPAPRKAAARKLAPRKVSKARPARKAASRAARKGRRR